MSAIPSKRLLVYAAAGVLVLAVGAFGLLGMRASDPSDTEGMVLDASGISGGDGTEVTVLPVPLGPGASSSTTVTTELIFVQVAGAVRRPGVYEIPSDARVFQAVLQAGGFTDVADQEAVPLAARLTDGCRLYVPEQGETVSGSVLSATPVEGGASAPSAGPVSLNAASLEELDSLPGIGPALAQQIISYRETQGPFTSVDQLTDVPGIGPSKLEQLRPLVGL
jgi:competence protein ComEA